MKSLKKRLLRRTGSRGVLSLLVLTLVLGVLNFFTKQNDRQLVEVIKKPASLAHLAHADTGHTSTDSTTDSDGGGGSDGSDSDGGSSDSDDGGTAEGNGDTCA